MPSAPSGTPSRRDRAYLGRHRSTARTAGHVMKPVGLSVFAITATAGVANAAMPSATAGQASAGTARMALPVAQPAVAQQAAQPAAAQAMAAPAINGQPAAQGVAAQGVGPQGIAAQDVVQAAPAKEMANLASVPALSRSVKRRFAASTSLALAGRAQAKARAEAAMWVAPVQGTRFTSPFGPRWGRIHKGNDFAGPIGLPLRAVTSGTITFVGAQSGFGNKVEITLRTGEIVYYGHMHTFAVKVGDKVAPGQVIGTLGNSGRSTGPHLHFELHPNAATDAVDPRPWLIAHGIFPGMAKNAAAPTPGGATEN